MKKDKMYRKIIEFLQENRSVTRQDISKQLKISTPTTLQYATELLEMGLLVENGELESTGGRKAKNLALNANIAYSVGIEVGLHQVTFVLLGYTGDMICKMNVGLAFKDDRDWYAGLTQAFELFLKQNQIDGEKIICGGVSFPGIIDDEKDMILRSHIFDIAYVGLDRFKNAFSFPITVVNDANCAAVTEVRVDKKDYFYLSLNESVGASIIQDGEIRYGRSLQAGEVGHVILIPNGKKCYCGKKGCADAYLSPKILIRDSESSADFFEKLAEGEEKVKKCWESYLEHLAILVTNLRMIQDTEIIIGGEMSSYLRDYLDVLLEKVQSYDMFARQIDYVSLSETNENACAIGAAKIALKSHFAEILSALYS